MGNNGLGLFKNKYRIPSNRLRGWDYANNGHYFITLVTFNRRCLFGEIVDNKMVLSDIGNIICDEFFKSFEMRTDLYLGEFVVMPNHIHTIVMMDRNDCVETHCRASHQTMQEYMSVETHCRASHHDMQGQPVETHCRASHSNNVCASLQRQPASISSFVAGFKSAAIKSIDDWIDANGKQIKKFGKSNPLWQTNYYDHIVRNADEYRMIAKYIIDNPFQWSEDSLSKPLIDESHAYTETQNRDICL